MAHHKRKKPKSGRAGCLMCKPHKDQRRKDCLSSQTVQERKAREAERLDVLSCDVDERDDLR